jgi:hypothetical protein
MVLLRVLHLDMVQVEHWVEKLVVKMVALLVGLKEKSMDGTLVVSLVDCWDVLKADDLDEKSVVN